MDQQLKQRLIGVTIVVALVIIFVPMLFEKSDDKGKFSSTGIPSIPDDVMEKTIELPKTAEDLAPNEDEKQPVESGYRIVPLNEELPPKPKPVDESGAKAMPGRDSGEEENPALPKEEDQPGQVKSGRKVKRAIQPASETARAVPVQAPDSERPVPMVKRLVQPKASLTPKKTKSTSVTPPKQDEGATRKSVTIQKPETAQVPVTLKPKIKENKPKHSLPLPEADRDLEDEAVPVPAKPETPQAIPKSSINANPKPKGISAIAQDAVKRPKTVKPSESNRPAVRVEHPETPPVKANLPQVKPKASKPAESERPAVKMEKLEYPPADASPQQVKPKVSKPAPTPVKPAKPADTEKIKPQTMAPGGWTVQPGSVAHITIKL